MGLTRQRPTYTFCRWAIQSYMGAGDRVIAINPPDWDYDCPPLDTEQLVIRPKRRTGRPVLMLTHGEVG